MELPTLLAAARAVLDHRSFAEAAGVIFDHACRLTGASSGYIALLSESGDENEVLFLDSGGLPCSVDPELPMPIRGLRAEAYRSGEVVYDNRFMKSDWVAFMPAGHMELRNVLFAPLNIAGRTQGIMGLANKQGDFTERDARLAATLGEYAAIALHNSRTLDELQDTVDRLTQALAEVKTLQGFLPICANCKKIRDQEGLWHKVEQYITDHSDAQMTHSLCDACLEELYPEED